METDTSEDSDVTVSSAPPGESMEQDDETARSNTAHSRGSNSEEGGEKGASDEGVSEEPIPYEEKTIEKILGTKYVTSDSGERTTYYLIKWKLKSYLHASWETTRALEAMDVNAKSKVRRFLQNPQETKNVVVPADEADEALYFNPEYLEPDRILSCDPPTAEHASAATEQDLQRMLEESPAVLEDVNTEIFYFVKWKRMSYNECTWERAYDLKNRSAEVFAFWQRQKLPKEFNYDELHLSVQDYEKIEVSPEFGEPGSGLNLRSYQLEGVNWLMWNWFHKRSCILADEMGLGKTIQTACFLHQLRVNEKLKIRGPHLIIAPLSLIRQWESELNEWCPDINCVVLHGNVEAKDTLVHNEFHYQEPFSSQSDIREAKKKNIYKFDVLLTTYEVVVRDLTLITHVNWKVLVLDEGHRLKNPSSRAFEKLLSIRREFCLLLTGTPLQNKTEELWSLLHFCNRSKFSDLVGFSKQFGDLKGSADVANLHAVLKPYLLRRIKEDVEKSLPPKEETIIEVTLTSIQKKYYRAVYERNAEFLYRGAKASNGPCLMNVMMELRKCCNHPYLMNGVEDRVLEDIHAANTESTESRLEIANRALVESSGKLVLLDKLLPRLRQEGHKVLIFSQMVRALNIIEDFINMRGYSYERLDGSTRVQDRLTAIDRFGNPAQNTFIMLLSTKAGGLGLNLTSADTVIIYDSDWNPQNDLQAQARAHRIGQTKPVVVYRLLTKATYEMQMFHRASLKLGLDRAVLAHTRREQHSDGVGGVNDSLTVSEIDELLKKGAYDVFREDESDIKEFMAADVDAILARSSTTVQYDKNAAAPLSGTLGKFSKASFVSADDTEDVDINDPDFWWKTMRIENKTGDGGMDDAAAYNQVVIGPDGEPKLVRSSLRKRKRTEGWSDSQAAQSDMTKSQKKQFYQPNDLEYADGNDYDYDSSSSDEKKKEKRKQRMQRVISANEKSGDKKKKATAMITMLENKFPGMNSLAMMQQQYQRESSNAGSRSSGGPFGQTKRPRPDAMVFSGDVAMSSDHSAPWTPMARDRCVDLLLRFGFGRWQAISRRMQVPGKADVGARSQTEIDAFCRNIVMQCGLSALNNNDVQQGSMQTDFIRHAISAAVGVQESIKQGVQHLEIPGVLLQDSFQKKLSSGRAIKALHRMDILNRVIAIVTNAVTSVQKKYPGVYTPEDSPPSVDDSVAVIPIKVLSEHIVANSARPPWLHVCDWWDDDCDSSLIIGTYKHGFSAYDDMGTDKDLCFRPKIKAAYTMYDSISTTAKDGVELGTAGPAVSIVRLDETKRCRLVIPARRYTEYIGVCNHPGSASWIAFRDNNSEPPDIIGYYVGELEAAKAYDSFIRAKSSQDLSIALMTNFELDGTRTMFKASELAKAPALPWFHSSVFHGVRSAGTKWQAKIGFEGVLRHVGTFATDIEAAVVHDRFALIHAQHTSVKINFRSARDVVAELKLYAERGDIQMDFFDVPKTEQSSSAYNAVASMSDVVGDLKRSMLGSTDSLSSVIASDVAAPVESSVAIMSLIESSDLGSAADASIISSVENPLSMDSAPVEGDFTTTELKPEEKSVGNGTSIVAAENSVLGDLSELVVVSKDEATPEHPVPLDAVAEIKDETSETAMDTASSAPVDPPAVDFEVPRGAMPDSRTLNRLLTYLLSVAETTKSDDRAKAVGAKRNQDFNQRKSDTGGRTQRKPRHDPVLDGAEDKTEVLRRLIKSGKVQAPPGFMNTNSLSRMENFSGAASNLSGIGHLTPEPTTGGSWEASNTFKNMSRRLSRQGPPPHEQQLESDDMRHSREAMLRVLARGKMGLQRDEISILADANGADPMFMIEALRAGILRNCELVASSCSLSREEFDSRLKALEDSERTPESRYIRRIIPVDDTSTEVPTDDVVLLPPGEKERLTSFFVIHGAPALNVDPNVHDAFPRTYLSGDILATSNVPRICPPIPAVCYHAMFGSDFNSASAEGGHGQVMSWNRVKIATNSILTAAELRWYYEEMWLPFCDAVTRPIAGLTREEEVYKGTIEVPNPFRDVSEHSPAARGAVETFLLHQRVIYTIRYVLWNQFAELIAFLHSDRGGMIAGNSSSYKSFPEWWCPWVHDIGVLVGMLMHGYLSMGAISKDPDLPFSESRLDAHFRKVFSNDSVVSKDVKLPEAKEIEHRTIYILTELTAQLPEGHFAKLSSVFVQGDLSVPGAMLPRRTVRPAEGGSSSRKRRNAPPKSKANSDSDAMGGPYGQDMTHEVRMQQEHMQQEARVRSLAQRYPQGLRPDAQGMGPQDPMQRHQHMQQQAMQMQYQMQNHPGGAHPGGLHQGGPHPGGMYPQQAPMRMQQHPGMYPQQMMQPYQQHGMAMHPGTQAQHAMAQRHHQQMQQASGPPQHMQQVPGSQQHMMSSYYGMPQMIGGMMQHPGMGMPRPSGMSNYHQGGPVDVSLMARQQIYCNPMQPGTHMQPGMGMQQQHPGGDPQHRFPPNEIEALPTRPHGVGGYASYPHSQR